MRVMLYYSIVHVVLAHLLLPVQACDLINQLAKKLVSSLAFSLVRHLKAKSKKKKKNLLPP